MKNQKAETQKKSFYAKLSYPKKRVLWGVIFLVPWMIGILLFFLGPLVKTFYYSFFQMTLENNGGFAYKFIGFENFKYALKVDPEFNQKIIEALLSVLKNVPFQIFVSLFIAILLNSKFKGRGLFRLIFFIPIILATGITKVDLQGVTITEDQAQSVVNANSLIQIITSAGIPTSIINVVLDFVNSIFEVITTAGIQMLIFLAGLQGISPTLYEVAKIEGCSGFESFCKITLPMISPMILVCTIYSLSDTFARAEVSDTISSITFTSGKYGLGASMSAIYFLVSVAVVLVVSLIVSKGVFYYDK